MYFQDEAWRNINNSCHFCPNWRIKRRWISPGVQADLDTGSSALAAAFASVMQVDNFIISAPPVQAGAGPLWGDV